MPRDAFVVSDGLIIDERAFGEVRRRNHDSARTLAIGSTSDVVGGCRSLKFWNGLDSHRRLGQQRKQLRKLGLHLRDVMPKIIEDLLGGRWDVFGIGLKRSAERGKIGE